eukprot:3996645-Amphidinium_carterae.2
MGEFKLLPPAAMLHLAQFLKTVQLTGVWPTELREMLYLQLPKHKAPEADHKRPINAPSAPSSGVPTLERCLQAGGQEP